MPQTNGQTDTTDDLPRQYRALCNITQQKQAHYLQQSSVNSLDNANGYE